MAAMRTLLSLAFGCRAAVVLSELFEVFVVETIDSCLLDSRIHAPDLPIDLGTVALVK